MHAQYTHISNSVKFWIIKNYMSPHHRRVVPLMAKRYGFDYAFVTYKWPHWLHKQTDKQRIIWCVLGCMHAHARHAVHMQCSPGAVRVA